MGRARFINTVRKLLKPYYRTLLQDAATERERTSVRLLKSRRGRLRIGGVIANLIEPDDDEDAGKMRNLVEQTQTRAEFLNTWIAKEWHRDPDITVHQQSELPKVESNAQEDQEHYHDYSSTEDGDSEIEREEAKLPHLAEEDQEHCHDDSSTEDWDSEIEREEAKLPHLAEMERFFRNSRPFQTLLNDFRKLLLPRLLKWVVQSIPKD